MREWSGGCLCGAVRYTVRGKPTHVAPAHCADCRKLSGSAFTLYGHWPLEAFELAGELAHFRGERFCGTCGSRIGQKSRTRASSCTSGRSTIRQTALSPEAELWIKRREPWLPPVEGASHASRTVTDRP